MLYRAIRQHLLALIECYMEGHPVDQRQPILHWTVHTRYHCQRCGRDYTVSPPDEAMNTKWTREHQ